MERLRRPRLAAFEEFRHAVEHVRGRPLPWVGTDRRVEHGTQQGLRTVQASGAGCRIRRIDQAPSAALTRERGSANDEEGEWEAGFHGARSIRKICSGAFTFTRAE